MNSIDLDSLDGNKELNQIQAKFSLNLNYFSLKIPYLIKLWSTTTLTFIFKMIEKYFNQLFLREKKI